MKHMFHIYLKQTKKTYIKVHFSDFSVLLNVYHIAFFTRLQMFLNVIYN